MNPSAIFRGMPILLSAGLLLSCQARRPEPPPGALPTGTPSPGAQTTAIPNGEAEPPEPIEIWVSPGVPPDLIAPVMELLVLPEGRFALADAAVYADVRVEPGADHPLAQWVYAAVAPFPTVEDSVSMEAIRARWQGSESRGPLFVSGEAAAALAAVLGAPDPEAVTLLPSGELLERAWAEQPSLALLPFEALEPRWKVMEIAGQSPIRTDFDPAAYSLIVPFGLSGEAGPVEEVIQALEWPRSNRDPERMTVLVMSGVSALVRGTAFKMNEHSPAYPGLRIGSWLMEADLAHVSHEVAFALDCPEPDPFSPSLRFCADPEHIALFDELGVDLIEATGNHLLDWGPEAFLYTLDLYDEHGWMVFGGGRDQQQAASPVIIEHHGNRLAFLGCNAAGPIEDWAGLERPGAARCTGEGSSAELVRLKEQGYLPVFTYQWPESKNPVPLPDQVDAFRAAMDAGAVIVSGSQAHRPQAMEFYGEGFIHYGLGNLFFDQMQTLANRQEFLDRHVFYEGRYLSVELLTAMLEDFAQPRPMSPAERRALLEEIFAASGW